MPSRVVPSTSGAGASFAVAGGLLDPAPGPGARSCPAPATTTTVAIRANARATRIGRRRGSTWNGVMDLLDGQGPGHFRDLVDLADERVGAGLEGIEIVDL